MRGRRRWRRRRRGAVRWWAAPSARSASASSRTARRRWTRRARLFPRAGEGLLEGGADFFILETFGDLSRCSRRSWPCASVTDLPVVAQMTIQEDGATTYGTRPDVLAKRLDEWGADVIGLNCSVGPAGMLHGVEQMAAATTKRLSAQPNAGLPREIHGRKMYMASPEYMAHVHARLIRAGAKFVGGCCGTTPEHTRRMADACTPSRRARSPSASAPRRTAAAWSRRRWPSARTGAEDRGRRAGHHGRDRAAEGHHARRCWPACGC
jgi:hypothetical protein